MLNTLNLYPDDTLAGTRVLFINFGGQEAQHSLKTVMKLRSCGVAAELYADEAKMKKQMAYANAKSIPFVAMIGENEVSTGTITLKNMATGDQENLTFDSVLEKLK